MKLSQKEKNKYHIILLICGVKKNDIYERFQSRNRDTDIEDGCMDTWGRGGRSEDLGGWDEYIYTMYGASLVAQLVKNLPVMQETWVQFLDQENPLEKEMITLSSILAWRIPWTEEPGRLQSVGSQESDMT